MDTPFCYLIEYTHWAVRFLPLFLAAVHTSTASLNHTKFCLFWISFVKINIRNADGWYWQQRIRRQYQILKQATSDSKWKYSTLLTYAVHSMFMYLYIDKWIIKFYFYFGTESKSQSQSVTCSCVWKEGTMEIVNNFKHNTRCDGGIFAEASVCEIVAPSCVIIYQSFIYVLSICVSHNAVSRSTLKED